MKKFLILALALSVQETRASEVQCGNEFAAPALTATHFQNVGPVQIHTELSPALRDPFVEKARQIPGLYDDYKYLSDLSPKSLTLTERLHIESQAKKIGAEKGEGAAIKFRIDSLYENKNELLPVDPRIVAPRFTVSDSAHKKTFEHVEKMWSQLVRQTPRETMSSLIPLPNPILIPGARFQEGYYWDTFFVFPILLKTGRENLVRGQIDNFLFMIKRYGMIYNGNRDYYQTRSQPPLISEMVRVYLEHLQKKGPLSSEILAWLDLKVFPLIKKDYHTVWMDKKTRFNEMTGLNQHFDNENTDRPERHSSDNENTIAKTKRDVRAEAESGKDFTDAFGGEATKVNGVMLNALLFQYEQNLSWIANLLGRSHEAATYSQAALRRKANMDKYNWDPMSGNYFDYNFRTGQRSSVLTADIFLALSTGLASPSQAARIVAQLPKLERAGGLMSSNVKSGKQWDAPYGWAPHHYFAIFGLMKYNYNVEARRLAEKWVQSIENVFNKTGKIIEKIDAVRGTLPVETGDKYPTQDGFLWTNGVYAWALTDVLGVPILTTHH